MQPNGFLKNCKQTKVLMNKSLYLDFSMLNLNKVEMYKFCYLYIKDNIMMALNYATQRELISSYLQKLLTFSKTLKKTGKIDLTHLIIRKRKRPLLIGKNKIFLGMIKMS